MFFLYTQQQQEASTNCFIPELQTFSFFQSLVNRHHNKLKNDSTIYHTSKILVSKIYYKMYYKSKHKNIYLLHTEIWKIASFS